MKTSESVAKISIALLAAQKAIKFAVKDSTNAHFKNSYADLRSVIDAIKEPLNNNGIVYLQSPSPNSDGKLSLTTRLLHESGEWIEDTADIPLPKADPQGYGSALTYGRRYALSAITGLYQDDDDDGNAASVEPTKPKAQPKVGLDENRFNDALIVIQEATDLGVLKNHFGLSYSAANNEQKSILKTAYDNRKKVLESK